jgi:predicted nucleotidyltransferase component of viral defense system
LAVADIKDLMAMKLKVLSERGELRDYYDVKDIDERGGVTVEEGLALFRER